MRAYLILFSIVAFVCFGTP